MNFQALLRLMNEHLQLDYTVVRKPSYVRVHRRGESPATPGTKTYPLHSIEGGTSIDGEQIKGMLESFDKTEQDFRDAYNAHYNLTQKDDIDVGSNTPPPTSS
jgi:hypothetical protein